MYALTFQYSESMDFLTQYASQKTPISGVICRILYTLRIMKFLCIFQPGSKRVWNYFLASLVTIRY